MTLLQHSTLVRGDTARGMQLADLAYTLQLQSASDDKLEGVSVLVEKEKNIVSFGILSAIFMLHMLDMLHLAAAFVQITLNRMIDTGCAGRAADQQEDQQEDQRLDAAAC